MKLKILERFVIQQILPEKGSLSEQLIVKDIRDKVGLKKAELDEVEFREEKGLNVWNAEKDTGKDVEFTKAEAQLLKDTVQKLDEKKEITAQMVDTCLKIKELDVA